MNDGSNPFVRLPELGPPDQRHSCDLAAVYTFRFPKTEALVIADRKVEFEFVFPGLSVRRTFDLRKMTVAGALAL